MLTEAVLARQPNFVPALKLKGMLLQDAGQTAEAEAAYERALKLAPDDADMLLEVGTAKLLDGRLGEAITFLQHRVRVVPADRDGNYYLAQAYHLQGQNERALGAIRTAEQAAPADVDVWQKYGELLCSAGQYEAAIPWLEKAKAADPTLHRINFDLAVASFDSMNLNAAVEYATAEAAATPEGSVDLPDISLLAAAEVKLGQWTQAESNLQRVLTVHPEDAEALMELGHCELELKNGADAVRDLQRSLQLDPTLVQAHYFLSRAYAAEGRATDAQHEAALHRELMQHLSFAVPRAEAKQDSELAGRAQQLLMQGKETAALQLFAEEQKGPYVTRGSAWMSVGATYLAMGKSQDAERAFRRALALDPKTPGIHTYLATLALQMGDLSQAETNLEAELALDPNHPLALGELGEVRYRQGRWGDAAELLTRSKTTLPLLLYQLCDAQFQLGKPQAADLTAEAMAAYSKGQPAMLGALGVLLQKNGQTELAARLAEQP